MNHHGDRLPNGVMFNAYPDSCGGSLNQAVALLGSPAALGGAFSLFYVLPSLYNSDLDRGFSVVDYGINGVIATQQDLDDIQALGLGLKLDFVLNHISVQSHQFQDLLVNGDESPYVDFFVDWNQFWEGNGQMGSDGYVIPDEAHLTKLFMRKPELPILKVPFPDGSNRFYWNTFYQQVTFDAPKASDLRAALDLSEAEARTIVSAVTALAAEGGKIEELDLGQHHALRLPVIDYVQRHCTRYLGQMDLNATSEQVWDYYDETLKRMKGYGAQIVRLDAFAYLHKEVGLTNFFNEPGTWEYVSRLKGIADKYGVLLLPEIHSRYDEATHVKLADHGFAFYDFFFPGLVIDALETGRSSHLVRWINEVVAQGYVTVNMLGCHDGIPMLDIKGLLDEESIDALIAVVLDRGGLVKNLYGADGQQISYYQVNATFYSALGEDDRKMLLARALQIFMPGVPEVWYLDLFNGVNDVEAAHKGGHKEINRTNLSTAQIESRLAHPAVQRQLKLLRFRNTFPAFGFDSQLAITESDAAHFTLTWTKDEHKATLAVDLTTHDFEITYSDADAVSNL
jgi:sucrose phosphorylase